MMGDIFMKLDECQCRTFFFTWLTRYICTKKIVNSDSVLNKILSDMVYQILVFRRYLISCVCKIMMT